MTPLAPVFAGWRRGVLPSTSRGAFWLVFALCLLGCVLFVELYSIIGNRNFSVYGQDGYFELANSLVRGDGFVFEPGGAPAHHRPPLYPLIVTPIVLLPASLQLPSLVLLHSLMIGAVGALIFTVALRLFNLSIARVAVILFLANPWLYSNVLSPLTPVFQCFLYVVFLYVVGREIVPALAGPAQSAKKASHPSWLPIGGIGGCLSLTHGTLIAVTGTVLLALILLSLRRGIPGLMRTAALAGLVSAILIAPWTYRNWVTFDRLIPVVGGAGAMHAFQYSHWDPSVPSSESMREIVRAPDAWKFHGVTDHRVDLELDGKALDRIRSNPTQFAKSLVFNGITYYFPTVGAALLPGGHDFGSSEQLALTALHGGLWAFVGLGLWHVRKKGEDRRSCWLLLLCVLLYAVWYFPFYTAVEHSMYTFATTPFLAILAAVGLVKGRWWPWLSLQEKRASSN